MDSNALVGNDVKLVKWDGAKWITLETSQKMKDGTYTYFEGETTSFSPFAISGTKGTPSPVQPAAIVTQPAPVITSTDEVPGEKAPANYSVIFGAIVVIAIIVALYFKYRSK